MKILLGLFGNIYSRTLTMFAAGKTAEIAIRTSLVAAGITFLTAIYFAYNLALNTLFMVTPLEYSFGLMFIPSNVTECMTVITVFRFTLFVIQAKIDLAKTAASVS